MLTILNYVQFICNENLFDGFINNKSMALNTNLITFRTVFGIQWFNYLF